MYSRKESFRTFGIGSDPDLSLMSLAGAQRLRAFGLNSGSLQLSEHGAYRCRRIAGSRNGAGVCYEAACFAVIEPREISLH